MSLTLSPRVFSVLSAFVEERLGLHYDERDIELFADKIAARVREAGFERALDYYYFLRYDAAASTELEALAESLVVGETYFFRELTALRAAAIHVVARAIAKRGRARVWSAACATGEEPLSLAMVLDADGIRSHSLIVATDISARALSKAREGTYAARSMRVVPPNEPPAGFSQRLSEIAAASLSPDGASRVRASRALVDAIDYRQLNLLDEAAIAALGSFDLILCRNVLIYFSDKTIRRVVASLAGALEPDGRLLVGSSESLLRFGTALSCEEQGGAFFYMKEAS